MPTNPDLVQYFAEQLRKNVDEIRPFTTKMFEEHCSLNTEDQYVLRELLVGTNALVTLLNEAAKPKPDTRPRWKQILNLK